MEFARQKANDPRSVLPWYRAFQIQIYLSLNSGVSVLLTHDTTGFPMRPVLMAAAQALRRGGYPVNQSQPTARRVLRKRNLVKRRRRRRRHLLLQRLRNPLR